MIRKKEIGTFNKKRFRNNPTLIQDYKTVIEEYKSLGIVEIVQPQDINSTNGNMTYYSPHHPLIRRDMSSSRLCIVFDASSHSPSQPSLNDVLLTGQNLNQDSFDLIYKFRCNHIAIVADIKKAFFQISLAESDSDMKPFLWIDRLPQNNDSPLKLNILKKRRILFGLLTSPYLLKAIIKHHLQKFETQYPEACSVISFSKYVDDLLIGA